jgi:hypothetical protein
MAAQELGLDASGRLRGAVNVGLQGRFAEWAGDVVSPDRDIVLVGDPALASESKIRLARDTTGSSVDCATSPKSSRNCRS